MFRPSFASIVSCIFLAYMANSIWSIGKLYFPPKCEGATSCLTSSLTSRPELRLIFATSTKSQPSTGRDFVYLGHLDLPNPFDPEPVNHQLLLDLPKEVTAKNGSLFMSIFSIPLSDGDAKPSSKNWIKAIRHPDFTHHLFPLTKYKVPEAKPFNLLGAESDEPVDESPRQKGVEEDAPVVHVKSKVFVSVMVDDVKVPRKQVPPELHPAFRLREPERNSYLPIVYVDELSQRIHDLRVVNKTDSSTEVTVVYRPISWGKLRIFAQFASALGSLRGLGFSDKDVDEVKGIFADTNMALLLVTFFVSAIHLLFDFLAFKNDIDFWHGRTNMTGLSTRTLLWRAFSHTVIVFYLFEENTSMLVLVPSGVGAIIEIWKATKAFGFSLSKGLHRKLVGDDKAEKYTESLDSEAMAYLSRVLYPLLAGGAVYSLLYTPHKSWRSWAMQSMVNGVYAFGFLFMLPQLFVNYRLKSVAHLPWRAFGYKAFNTFIDDLFAFIITMPTAHRVACLRDDVVFIVYLYQRYLYPVDKNRIDLSGMIDETVDGSVQKSQTLAVAAKPREGDGDVDDGSAKAVVKRRSKRKPTLD